MIVSKLSVIAIEGAYGVHRMARLIAITSLDELETASYAWSDAGVYCTIQYCSRESHSVTNADYHPRHLGHTSITLSSLPAISESKTRYQSKQAPATQA
jgi:hypothetical protein